MKLRLYFWGHRLLGVVFLYFLSVGLICAEPSDLEKVCSRALASMAYKQGFPYSGFEALEKEFEALKICDEEGAPRSIQVRFDKKAGAINFQEKIIGLTNRIFSAWQAERGERKKRAGELFCSLCRWLLENGFTEGQIGLGNIGNGYDWRVFPAKIFQMKEVLEPAGLWEPMLKSVLWFTGGEAASRAQTWSSCDYFYNYTIHYLQGIALLPDERERYRRMKDAANFYDRAIRKEDPFFDDGAVHHHWGQHFHYSRYAIPTLVSGQLQNLAGTEFEISEAAKEKLRRACWGWHMQSVNGIVPPNIQMRAGTLQTLDVKAFARDLAKLSTNKIDSIAAGIFLAHCDDPKDPDAKRFRDAGAKPLYPVGHLSVNSAAVSIHRRGNWAVAAAGMNDAFRCHEIYGWMEANNYSRTARNGSVVVSNCGETGFQEAGWNHNFWPGTTTRVLLPEELYEGYSFEKSNSRIAGGVNLRGDGIWAMDFRGDAVHFKKSVCGFDNVVFVLTTNIRPVEKGSASIVTTILQEKRGEKALIFDGQALPFPYKKRQAVETPTGFLDSRGNAYFVFAGTPLVVESRPQMWTYFYKRFLKDVNVDPCIDIKTKKFKESPFAANAKYYKPSSGEFHCVRFDHGNAPENADCLYAILPESSPDALAVFSAAMSSENPPYRILQKDKNAQVFFDVKNETYACAVFNSNAKFNNSVPIEKISDAGFVMIRGKGKAREVAYASSNPELAGKTITIALRGESSVYHIPVDFPKAPDMPSKD